MEHCFFLLVIYEDMDVGHHAYTAQHIKFTWTSVFLLIIGNEWMAKIMDAVCAKFTWTSLSINEIHAVRIELLLWSSSHASWMDTSCMK